MARSTRSDGSDKAPGRSAQFRTVAGHGRRQLWTNESKRSDEPNPFAEMMACCRAASTVFDADDGDMVLLLSMAYGSEQSDAREAYVRYVPWSADHEASRLLMAKASASTNPFLIGNRADTARAAHAAPEAQAEFDEEVALKTSRARGRNRPPMDAKTRAGFEQLRSELD